MYFLLLFSVTLNGIISTGSGRPATEGSGSFRGIYLRASEASPKCLESHVSRCRPVGQRWLSTTTTKYPESPQHTNPLQPVASGVNPDRISRERSAGPLGAEPVGDGLELQTDVLFHFPFPRLTEPQSFAFTEMCQTKESFSEWRPLLNCGDEEITFFLLLPSFSCMAPLQH